MISFKEFQEISEAAYAGNIGVMELVKFYQKAPPEAVHKIKQLIASKQHTAAWKLVQKHTGVKLHPSAYR